MTNTKLVKELTKFAHTLPSDTRMSAQDLVVAYQKFSNGTTGRAIEAGDLEFVPKVVKLIVRAFGRSDTKRVVLYFNKKSTGVRVMTFERMTKCLATIVHAKRGLRAYYDRGGHLKRGKK